VGATELGTGLLALGGIRLDCILPGGPVASRRRSWRVGDAIHEEEHYQKRKLQGAGPLARSRRDRGTPLFRSARLEERGGMETVDGVSLMGW